MATTSSPIQAIVLCVNVPGALTQGKGVRQTWVFQVCLAKKKKIETGVVASSPDWGICMK